MKDADNSNTTRELTLGNTGLTTFARAAGSLLI